MIDRTLFVLTSTAILIGILASYSLSAYTILYFEYGQFHFFIRQLISGIIGITLMWLISRGNPDSLVKNIGFLLFFVCMVLMLVMHFLPESLATSAGGAKRWIRFPFFSLSPVEFFKIGFIFFLAWSFARKYDETDSIKEFKEEFRIFLPYGILLIILGFLIAILQNDLGQIFLLGITFVLMLLCAGGSFKLFFSLLFGAIFAVFILIVSSDHRILRIKQWWAISQKFILSILPEWFAAPLRVENLPEPYQIQHSLNAIQNGGFFGEGLGNGLIKLGFLSEVHTDIVLAGIAEEVGLFGLILCVILFLAIIYRIFRIANRSQSQVSYLFCIGIGLMLGFSFLINAYGISGLTPIKGIAVPFYSYGGSSLIANCIAIGLVLCISKKTLP
ncbi:cell division protein [Helicobacter monodelphidis]|nr:cell division protein [Helicobacter sp. 15-1451]